MALARQLSMAANNDTINGTTDDTIYGTIYGTINGILRGEIAAVIDRQPSDSELVLVRPPTRIASIH